MRKYWDKIPSFLRNKYSLTLLLFIIWMSFIDRNDFFSQLSLNQQLKEMEAERKYYQEKLQEVQLMHKDLFKNEENLERYAREQYLMKKDGEELFIIVEE
ncbi:MAG: septum formation initiator family protein [Chitinophagales bacterium]